MADVHSKIDELTATLESAKSVPLSASCVIHRAEVLAALDEIRQLLPAELAAADDVLRERGDVVADGEAEAAAIIADAISERDRLVDATEVNKEATARAAQLVATAEQEALTMRLEVEDYVDGKLANFEVVLHKTMAAVTKGRNKLRGTTDAAVEAEFATGDPTGDGAGSEPNGGPVIVLDRSAAQAAR